MSCKRLVSLVLVIVLLTACVPVVSAAAKTYTGTINKDKINFRAKASTSSAVLSTFRKGDKVKVTGISGNFYSVTFNKVKGYVMRKFVALTAADKKALETQTAAAKKTATPRATATPKSKVTPKPTATPRPTVKSTADPAMKGITRISQIQVPATSKKGDSGAKVKALQQALKLKNYYKAAVNSKFDSTTVEAVKAFQKASKLEQTGKADYATIQKLFGKKAADFTYKTEKLDWFNGGANVIPRGATFTVKDVLTGKTFKCKRLYGANHMDTEPYNADATATIKQLYGGNWSWNRRAVLVLYNGHVYAGSMNGMPHGNCRIKNNNFDGHFCIHFYGSKTHGSKKVDGAHQKAVQRALRAKW